MKNKILLLLSIICLVVFIPTVLAYELKPVSITEGGTQFVSIPSDKNVVYSYASDIPQNGLLILSLPENDTYLLDSDNTIEFITVSKVTTGSIIDMILGWL